MKKLIALVLTSVPLSSFAPPNCNIYKDNEPCYNACLEAKKAIMHSQGSKPSQMHFDKSIEWCSTFDYSYYEKAVPYAKRGLMREWKIMIDKAVELDPEEHLGTRGWYHYFFMRNYDLAIKDIDKLDSMSDYDIGYTGNGKYHLNIMKALCYKGIGDKVKAVEIIEEQLVTENYEPMLYDYLHLGVLYMETERYEDAKTALKKQIEINDVAEPYYYLSLTELQLGNVEAYHTNLEKSLDYYERGYTLTDPYTHQMDKIFKETIESELNNELQAKIN